MKWYDSIVVGSVFFLISAWESTCNVCKFTKSCRYLFTGPGENNSNDLFNNFTHGTEEEPWTLLNHCSSFVS
jgi:hypothetical protein